MSFVEEFQKARGSRRVRWRDLSQMKKDEAKTGFKFVSLWLVGFLAFYALPMVASFVFSLMDFQLTNPDNASFVGLANWSRMLFNDQFVWQSMGVTFIFALISLPIGMIVALALAILLNSNGLLGRDLFRTAFYMPSMIPLIASVFIWRGVLNPQTGWLNRLIEWATPFDAVGVNGIRWLDDPSLIYVGLTYIGIWGVGNAILINLASLQSVPTALYEAAEVDGAGWIRKLWSITLPMISPVIFYNLIIGTVGVLQYFLVPYVLTGTTGAPDGTTRFYMIYFFQQAFGFTQMGYGSALAWLMFIVGLIITVLLFGSARYWVYYEGERK